MIYENPDLVKIVQEVIEFVGTFAFAISGIRHAAARHFDWFGGFVCGIVVAIGGGTIRDVMLGETPFWMTSALYLVCTALAQVFVITFAHSLKRLDNAWFVFDTLGLALFTIAGMQKTLACGHPFWVAVIMGCITGSAGGVIRDILLNKVPVIFHKEIYAMASVAGGVLYWVMLHMHVHVGITAVITFFVICLIRYFAVRYHISLPLLRSEEK
ncbi:trimeric intracellular cation channel family protein [Hoylesella enoeca]|uniref:trimeric intracellular cation channel family protein n=1 Tax=Hoylesella enoeca TaxID=76123 RepID=UPI00288AB114|nr:trimeric intracellular cation channel family protein [Hoylesella enoeca]